ncbi:PrsW family intramembrane metalloprotease [Knoellia sp. p5-6-4]|uniref:PrsW family intramembrane metalloprotease n=1 Tax=unclassified Knoellia TaxID=2618719 RepID=UPI0023DB7D63|nr:PrsW family intramembrane metalloprotease [Knoellia sp. p5-6-4]MDF2146227.1 PrsW family intramembrane metalloprotease [Knoellia sp. p5-6-4]
MTWGPTHQRQGYAGGPPSASGHQPAPVSGRATSRGMLRGWIITGVAVVGFALTGLVLAAYYGMTLGVLTSFLAILLAAIPLAIVIPTFLWLDRFEAEPTKYLVAAFLWGALIAAVLAGLLNTSAHVVFSAATDPEQARLTTAVFVAPVVEEAAKGLFVLLVWQLRRREFDGVIDGMVYAGVAAAGFAFTENIQYLGLAYVEGGEQVLTGVFIARCLVTPFAHPIFTVVFGIGVGMAATSRGAGVRLGAPLAGFALAVLLHGIWNLAAISGGQGLVAVFLLVEIPIFLSFIGLVVWARAREGRLIGRFLMPYADAGWLTPGEVHMLSRMSLRRGARVWARQTGGRAALASMRAYQDAASELALLRQRMYHSAADANALESERRLLDTLVVRRREFTGAAY